MNLVYYDEGLLQRFCLLFFVSGPSGIYVEYHRDVTGMRSQFYCNIPFVCFISVFVLAVVAWKIVHR